MPPRGHRPQRTRGHEVAADALRPEVARQVAVHGLQRRLGNAHPVVDGPRDRRVEVEPDDARRPLGALQERQQRHRERLQRVGAGAERGQRRLRRGLQEVAAQRVLGRERDRVQDPVEAAPPLVEVRRHRGELLGLVDVELEDRRLGRQAPGDPLRDAQPAAEAGEHDLGACGLRALRHGVGDRVVREDARDEQSAVAEIHGAGRYRSAVTTARRPNADRARRAADRSTARAAASDASSTRATPVSRFSQALISRKDARRAAAATRRDRGACRAAGPAAPRPAPPPAPPPRTARGTGTAARPGEADRRRTARAAGATSAATGTKGSCLGRLAARRSAGSSSIPSSLAGRAQDMAQLGLDLAGVGAEHRIAREVHPAVLPGGAPAIVRTKRPTIWRKIERRLGGRGVDADAQARDVDALGDHVDGDDPRIASGAERLQLLVCARLGVQRRRPARRRRSPAAPWRCAGRARSPRRPRARRRRGGRPAHALQPLVGRGEDLRQAVAQLGRDGRAVAAARVARRSARRRTTASTTSSPTPLQRAVVGDERHRAADAVADGVGVGVGDVRHGDAVVVAHAGDRPWRPSGTGVPESSSQRRGLRERRPEALCPRRARRRGGGPRRR